MRLMMMMVVVSALAARSAYAQKCIAPAQQAAQGLAIGEANTTARDKALEAAGLTFVKLERVTAGAGSGDYVTVKGKQRCELDDDDFVFAQDKSGNVVRVIAKTTATEKRFVICGAESCEAPLCGGPPTDVERTFVLRSGTKYAGDREVAWKKTTTRVSYQRPCSELDKLRVENAALRQQRDDYKAKLDKLLAQQRQENERLKVERHKLNKQLK